MGARDSADVESVITLGSDINVLFRVNHGRVPNDCSWPRLCENAKPVARRYANVEFECIESRENRRTWPKMRCVKLGARVFTQLRPKADS